MEQNVTYKLKQRIQAGEKIFSTLIGNGNDPEKTVRALKEFGYDYIMVDNEHCLVGKETIYHYIRAAKEVSIPILIRPEDKIAYIRYYLNSGANGIMLPHLDTVEEAIHAVHESYYPPIGHRGSAIGLSPYLVDFQSPTEVPYLALTEYINNNTMVIPQTESLENISNLRTILRLEGIDFPVVGTKDLALDIGSINPKHLMSEMISTDIMTEKLKLIAKICKEAGKPAGVGGFSPKVCAKWAKEGYTIFELGFVQDGNVEKVKILIEEARSLMS